MGQVAEPSAAQLFSEHYRRHYDEVLSYARRRLPEDAARDATAEIFTTAWRRWDVAERGGLPWLFTTASHVVATARRSARRRGALLAQAAAQPATPPLADHAEAHAERQAVLEAVRLLPDRDRELLLLTVWEQLDVPTAARVVGTSAGAAHVRLHRARRRLRVLLTAHDRSGFSPLDARRTEEARP